MRITENTLSLDDPNFVMLARNIEVFQREFLLSSDLNHGVLILQQNNPLARRNSFRQSGCRLVCTSN